MSGRGHRLLPAVLVLGGYIAADLLLDGLAAAAAVMALGLGEFLVLRLLPEGTSHPSLIVEAAVLAGTGLLGEILSDAGYPGAGYAILEVILGGFLLGSALRGKPWLAGKVEETGLRTSKPLMQEASVVLGGMFLLHGLLLTSMVLLAGGIQTIPAIAAFMVLYILALVLLRRRSRVRAIHTAPRLVPAGEGMFRLQKGDQPLATFALETTGRPVISDLVMEEINPAYKVLEALESALASAGAPSVTISDWEGDTLTLEMAGYISGPSGWTKPLRSPRMR